MKIVASCRILGPSSLRRRQILAVAVAIVANVTSFALGTETLNEIRRYTSPIQTLGFGADADISSKYAAVIGYQGTEFVTSNFHAFIFDANTGEHLWTLTQPVPADNVNFRFSSVAVDGDLVVIGATAAHVPRPGGGVVFNAGAAFVYDLSTGQLKHKLISDTPQNNFDLGNDVDILGNRIVVAARNNAYVFDADSGAQLARLTPTSPSDSIGGSVALSESAILVGENAGASHLFTGAAYAFDAQTFEQISKIIPDDVVAHDQFGWNVGIDGDIGIASGRGGVYVFDVIRGNQLAKLELPGGPLTVASLVDIQGAKAYLSNPESQQAAVYDWTTGSTLYQLVRGNAADSNAYGTAIEAAGNKILVGAVGRAFQFQIPEPSCLAQLLVGMLLISRRRVSRL